MTGPVDALNKAAIYASHAVIAAERIGNGEVEDMDGVRRAFLRIAAGLSGAAEAGAAVAELIEAGDFLATNGTPGMVNRWNRAKAAAGDASRTIAPEGVPAGLAAAAEYIQKKADAYAEENCGTEWDTGATTYHFGQAGEDYHHVLLELAEEIAALANVGSAS